MIRYMTERPKMNRILDLTSLTVAEFETLVPAFEAAFVQHMADWALEGTARMGRRYSQYATCPLPTPEDRLLFLLMYLKHAPTQVAHGAALGMGQSKANQWLHILLVALRNGLHTLGRSQPATGRPPAPHDRHHQRPRGRPLLHDGTERPMPRPQDPDEQTRCYSGK
jgi:hypothetical protein